MDVEISLLPYAEVGNPPASVPTIDRILREGLVLKVGRQVVKDGQVQTKTSSHGLDIWYQSKVISRTHAELWAKDGQIYIRDVGSSSGTFLNKMRLSPSAKGSRPYPLKNGDTIQFGVDYKGKTEDIFKAVTIKVAFADQFSQMRRKQGNPVKFQSALKNLLAATNPYASSSDNSQDTSNISTECCICIGAIGPYQALFISPCSHCFHYKCVSVILTQSAMFQCPMCRQVANLTASVSMESINELDNSEMTPTNVGSDSDISMVACGTNNISYGAAHHIHAHLNNERLEAGISQLQQQEQEQKEQSAPQPSNIIRPASAQSTGENNSPSQSGNSNNNSGASTSKPKSFSLKISSLLGRKTSSANQNNSCLNSPSASGGLSPSFFPASTSSPIVGSSNTANFPPISFMSEPNQSNSAHFILPKLHDTQSRQQQPQRQIEHMELAEDTQPSNSDKAAL